MSDDSVRFRSWTIKITVDTYCYFGDFINVNSPFIAGFHVLTGSITALAALIARCRRKFFFPFSLVILFNVDSKAFSGKEVVFYLSAFCRDLFMVPIGCHALNTCLLSPFQLLLCCAQSCSFDVWQLCMTLPSSWREMRACIFWCETG